jgi:DNA polymerase III epsilon subunit-like protein
LPLIFEIDIENVRNTRYRDHGGAIQKGITEIAIYKFDGHEIVDQLLVNPEIPIQPL